MMNEEYRIELECVRCGHRYLSKNISKANDRCYRDVPVTDEDGEIIDIEQCKGKLIPLEENTNSDDKRKEA